MSPLRYRKLGPIEQGVLSDLTGGDLLVGFLFSNHSSRGLFRAAHTNAQARARARHAYLLALRRMQQQSLVQLLEKKDGTYVRIAPHGKDMLALSRVSTQLKPSTWDGQWRVVSFDIPNDHKELRHELRRLLLRIGFVHMQQSVYVFPYAVPVLEKIFAERRFPISQVAYSTVSRLAHDTLLRKHFKL